MSRGLEPNANSQLITDSHILFPVYRFLFPVMRLL